MQFQSYFNDEVCVAWRQRDNKLAPMALNYVCVAHLLCGRFAALESGELSFLQ
jgi:hypothetical protein